MTMTTTSNTNSEPSGSVPSWDSDDIQKLLNAFIRRCAAHSKATLARDELLSHGWLAYKAATEKYIPGKGAFTSLFWLCLQNEFSNVYRAQRKFGKAITESELYFADSNTSRLDLHPDTQDHFENAVAFVDFYSFLSGLTDSDRLFIQAFMRFNHDRTKTAAHLGVHTSKVASYVRRLKRKYKLYLDVKDVTRGLKSEILRLYSPGDTVAELARRLGKERRCVRAALVELSIYVPAKAHREARIKLALEAGLTIKAIAAETGLQEKTVYRIAKGLKHAAY
jgi:DNA-directed RNA polymerase specialized sigma24 family protein